MTDTRAVSEVVGFVIVFAIITTAIGIIFTSGIGGLQDARDSEQLQNVERAFEVLATNLEEVRRYGVPSRSTELRLQEGRLLLGAQTRIRVNVMGTTLDTNVTMRPLTYTSGDFPETAITYEGGALFREADGRAVMLAEPGWLVTEDRLYLPGVVTFRDRGPNSLSTSGTALVIAQETTQNVFREQSSTDFTVRITINSPRAGAWARHLENKGFTLVSGGGQGADQAVLEIEVTRLVLIKSFIGLELSP